MDTPEIRTSATEQNSETALDYAQDMCSKGSNSTSSLAGTFFKKKPYFIAIPLLITLVAAIISLFFIFSHKDTEMEGLFSQGLLPVAIEDDNGDLKWGYVNKKGEYVIKPQFDHAYNFSSNGLAMVEVNDKYGYINKDGSFAILPLYEKASIFASNGLAFAYLNGSKAGYIDKSGSFVIEPQFDSALSFGSSDLAPVQVNGAWGYIDQSGTFVIPPQFEAALWFFEDGLAPVCMGWKWGFINREGTFVIEPQFDQASSFNPLGYSTVSIDGDTKLIDATGAFCTEENQVVQDLKNTCQYVGPLYFDRRCVMDASGKVGYLNGDEELVIPTMFDSFTSFGYYGENFYPDGYSIACLDDKLGVIDRDGNFVISPQFDAITYYEKG